MHLLDGSRSQRLDNLITLALVLGILLILLVAVALLSDLFSFLDRFRQPIFLFIAGAILAYLLTPVVRSVQIVTRRKALAVAVSYVILFVVLLAFGVLLINPFITEARALQNNLQKPAAGSLRGLQSIQTTLKQIQINLATQRQILNSGHSVGSIQIQTTQGLISQVQSEVPQLSASHPPRGQTGIPSSYTRAIATPLNQLAGDYARATAHASSVDAHLLDQSLTDAKRAVATTTDAYQKEASTPILLLNLQSWLDDHGVSVDLHAQFGKALQQLSNQVSGVVGNALGFALKAGNLLLNTVLVLLISIYFISDGARFVRWLVNLAPPRSRPRAAYFVTSLDEILGAYLRAQVVLALLAGGFSAAGALLFGVPYAIVIFFSSFLLSLVPVIGPVVLPLPPLLIALLFAPLPKLVFYALWLLAGEQIITNVLGPRVQGRSLGIHPLEAMAAALVGFPLAGFLGSFFAVPIVAFLHVVARSFVHTRRAVPTVAEEREPTPVG